MSSMGGDADTVMDAYSPESNPSRLHWQRHTLNISCAVFLLIYASSPLKYLGKIYANRFLSSGSCFWERGIMENCIEPSSSVRIESRPSLSFASVGNG